MHSPQGLPTQQTKSIRETNCIMRGNKRLVQWESLHQSRFTRLARPSNRSNAFCGVTPRVAREECMRACTSKLPRISNKMATDRKIEVDLRLQCAPSPPSCASCLVCATHNFVVLHTTPTRQRHTHPHDQKLQRATCTVFSQLGKKNYCVYPRTKRSFRATACIGKVSTKHGKASHLHAMACGTKRGFQTLAVLGNAHNQTSHCELNFGIGPPTFRCGNPPTDRHIVLTDNLSDPVALQKLGSGFELSTEIAWVPNQLPLIRTCCKNGVHMVHLTGGHLAPTTWMARPTIHYATDRMSLR